MCPRSGHGQEVRFAVGPIGGDQTNRLDPDSTAFDPLLIVLPCSFDQHEIDPEILLPTIQSSPMKLHT